MDLSKRAKDFKKVVSQDDGRRRREASAQTIRKDKKEEGLAKRRNVSESTPNENGEDLTEITSSNEVTIPSKRVYTAVDIPQLFLGLQSTKLATQVESLRGFRRLLSMEKNAPIQDCIDCGAVPLIVSFLQRTDSTELPFEAAWVLTNIASTDKTSVVADFGAIPHLVALLLHANADIREQSAWCLGNIAGDGSRLRDLVFQHGGIGPIITNLQNPASLSLLRNCTWTLSNLCRGKPQAPMDIVGPALPVLAHIVFQNQDVDSIVDSIWALSYMSDGENARIQAVVDTGVVPHLVSILGSDKTQAVVPALRTLGNIVSGDDKQTQCVLDAGALTNLVPLLVHAKKNIRKEACWLLSNVCAGTPAQLTMMMNTPHLLAYVLQQMSAASEWDVRKEACWAVCNVASMGSIQHIHQLVEHGGIRPLCDLLNTGDVRLIIIVMEAIEAIMKVGHHGSVQYITLIDEAGGIDNLESLQEHENAEVYAKSVKLIETYFGGEDAGESENIAPAVVTDATGNSMYSFGIPAGHDFGLPAGADKLALMGQAAGGFQF